MLNHVGGDSTPFKTAQAPQPWKHCMGTKTSRRQNVRRQNMSTPKLQRQKVLALKCPIFSIDCKKRCWSVHGKGQVFFFSRSIDCKKGVDCFMQGDKKFPEATIIRRVVDCYIEGDKSSQSQSQTLIEKIIKKENTIHQN